MTSTIRKIKEKLPITKTLKVYHGSNKAELMSYRLSHAVVDVNHQKITIDGAGYYFSNDKKIAEHFAMAIAKKTDVDTPYVISATIHYKKALDLRKLYGYYNALSKFVELKGVCDLDVSDQKKAARLADTSLKDIQDMESVLPSLQMDHTNGKSPSAWNIKEKLKSKGYDLIYTKTGNPIVLNKSQIEIRNKEQLNKTLYERLNVLQKLTRNASQSKGLSR